MRQNRLPKYWNERELSYFFSAIRRDRDRLMMFLMARCGLRVSELCSLKLDDINWDERSIRVIGKGDKERVIPLNDQVYDLLVSYLEKRSATLSAYVISNLKGASTALNRRTVFEHVKRYADRANLPNGHPHTLRHSFGTMLASKGERIERIAELMGHENINTTRIYSKVSALQKRKAVSRLDSRPWLIRLMSRFDKKYIPEKVFISRDLNSGDHTSGRARELSKLKSNLAKGVDTLLIGGPGLGKSHLLNHIHSEKVIRVPLFSPVKQAVLSVAEALFKNGLLHHGVEDPGSWADVRRAHSRATVRQWCRMILDSVERNEWILIVDDLTDITHSAVISLNQLNQKFIVFGAMRHLKPSHEHYFWKYDRIDLDTLTRYEAVSLIRYLCRDARIEDYQLFETHVLQRSGCNPRAILEIVERAKKEPIITAGFSRKISHSGAVKKIDLSPVFVLFAAAFIASRFIARGAGSMEGYVFTGVGGALFMALRFFAGRARR